MSIRWFCSLSKWAGCRLLMPAALKWVENLPKMAHTTCGLPGCTYGRGVTHDMTCWALPFLVPFWVKVPSRAVNLLHNELPVTVSGDTM